MNLSDKVRMMIEAHPLRDYLYQMIKKESGGKGSTISSTGAAGLLQFTRGTGKSYGLIGPGFDKRRDDVSNVSAGIKLTEDNMRILRKALNREPTYSELALAHQQGAQTAVNMLTGVGNASPRNLAVNKVNPNASPQAAAERIMNYYGFDGRQKMPPGMSLAYNPNLPQLQHGPTAPSPFPAPAAPPPAAPEPGLLTKLGLTTPETEATLQAKAAAVAGKDNKGLEGLDMIAKGLSPQVPAAAQQAAATLTPMSSPDTHGAQNAMAAQQLMAALIANRQKKYGLSLTGGAP